MLIIRVKIVILLVLFVNSLTAAELSSELDSVIHDRINSGLIPGIVIGIVNENGYNYFGFGQSRIGSDVTPDEDTIYEIGSITKTFTTSLLADMVLKGELAFEYSVSDLLPNIVSVPDRGGKQITLEHLATHSSALPRLPTNLSSTNDQNPFADYSVSDMYDFLNTYKLERNIGEIAEYSNLGVGLLGHALSLHSKTDYEQLLVDRLLNPMGLDNTAISLSTSMNEKLAAPYKLLNGELVEVENWEMPTIAGAGALRSSAKDLLRYLGINLGFEDSLLYPTLKLTHEPRARFSIRESDAHIGLGWIIQESDSSMIHWHNGITGGYRSFVGFSLTNKVGVVVLSNSNISMEDIGHHLLNPSYLLQSLSPPETRKEIILTVNQISALAGTYQLTPSVAVVITVQDNRIFAQVTGQQRYEIFAQSPTEFFYKVVDAQIIFELDQLGQPNRIVLNQNGASLIANRTAQNGN